MLQRKIFDPKHGAELIARQIGVDQAMDKREIVRIRWKHVFVAESNRFGCNPVDVVGDIDCPYFAN